MNKNLFVIAEKEWRDGWRNRWFLSVTLIFALIAFGITWFGSATQGQSGLVSLDATLASLSSLTVIVIPLIALMIGFDAFVGEQEQGTLLLLFTYPVSKLGWIFGKFLGQFSILFIAIVLGFGCPFLFLAFEQSSAEFWLAVLTFLSSSALLGATFLTLAHFLSLLVNEKAKAAGLALFCWFFLTLLYDLALLAVIVGTAGWLSPFAFKLSLLANPTDIFRIINLVNLNSEGSGVLASIEQMNFSLWPLYGLLGIWIALLMLMSLFVLTKKRF